MTQMYGLSPEEKQEYPYRASLGKTPFHLTVCWRNSFIGGLTEIGYRTYREAIQSGRTPCRVCTPDSIEAKH